MKMEMEMKMATKPNERSESSAVIFTRNAACNCSGVWGGVQERGRKKELRLRGEGSNVGNRKVSVLHDNLLKERPAYGRWQ